jgi:integrase/recombinase XerD
MPEKEVIMSSLVVILYKSKTYADGKHPIMLQYIYGKKILRKVVHRCRLAEWDEKSSRVRGKVTGAAYINNVISEKLIDAERQSFQIEMGLEKPENIFIVKGDHTTLEFAISQELVRLKSEMKAGTYGKVLGFRAELQRFTGISSLKLSDMNLNWFSRYAIHLKGKGNIGATAQKKIKTIRAMVARYSTAPLSEDLKRFGVKTMKSVKQKLTPDELASLEHINLPEGDILTAVRDLFLLQVYLRGIRVGDLLQAYSHSFKDGLFTYTDDKTGQSFSIKLIGKAQAIVDRYSGKHERLFPLMEWEPNKRLSAFDNKRARMKEKEMATAVVNKYLKILAKMAGIDKPLSSHIARHTFARMALDKITNPMVTMELLGHSSLAIHQTYLKDLRKDDQLNDAAVEIFGDN